MPNFGPIFSQGEIWSMIDYIWTFQFQEWSIHDMEICHQVNLYIGKK
jgi:hypothetical protein